MEKYQEILQALPYGPGFCFVDRLNKLDAQGVEGEYQFRRDAFWYAHHFPAKPITPGVLLIECMAQIGLVCLGLFLLEKDRPGLLRAAKQAGGLPFLFGESEVVFARPLSPGEVAVVKSERRYWRLGKLKCSVRMEDADGRLIASGTLSGLRGREALNLEQ